MIQLSKNWLLKLCVCSSHTTLMIHSNAIIVWRYPMKFQKNSVIKAIAFILALSSIVSFNNTNVYAAPTDQVIFADNALEQKLISLGVDGGDSIITQGEMSSLTGSLDLSDSDIIDLTGLEYANSISNLNLSNNNISNVTALESLTALINLDVSNNYLTQEDITNLEAMLPSCTITSDTQRIKVDSITLRTPKKTLCIGDNYSLSAEVSPADATDQTLTYSSADPSIATISSTGIIEAKALGQTTITVTAEHNQASATCMVYVVSDKLKNKAYRVNRTKGWIYRILPNTTVSSLKKQFYNPSWSISVYNGSKKLSNTNYVGTGMTIKLKINGKVRESLKLIVRGDINGDGKATGTDYLLVKKYYLKRLSPNSIQKVAADINGNGKINVGDFMKIRLHALKLRKINNNVYYNPTPTGNAKVDKFLKAAFSVLYRPYQWGHEIYDSTTRPRGTDCSGLVYYSLRKIGYPIGRCTANTYSKYWLWEKVSLSKLKSGDLIFFNSDSNPGTIGHVGIYLGEGYFIHASSSYGCVVICKLEGWYLTHFSHGRRVF